MALHRKALPQLGAELFLTDGGIETDLIFNDGADLPLFAAFTLLKTAEGTGLLRRYFERYAAIATRFGRGFILESPTWRASREWGEKLGYDEGALRRANREAIALMALVRDGAAAQKPIVISGCIGPRGDGYDPGALMTIREAEDYHSFQAAIFADSEADMIAAVTMTNIAEATGISRAAAAAGMPVAISFTVETDGCLPTGEPLGDAVMEVDFESPVPPAYYMINCAHPTHFEHLLRADEPWLGRLKGLRVNASKASHAELNEAPELDAGNPVELAQENAALRRLLPGLTVLGGCCGTDARHIEEMAKAAA